jgi:succinoglycan biosynthesis protein ExoM
MHIDVCICTYRRPQSLSRLLQKLARQETTGLFEYSLIVVDNDQAGSARAVVRAFQDRFPIPIVYRVEPEQSIARARNRAVETSQGDLLAFLDDDEFPVNDWLLTLFIVLMDRRVDGVLGPVKPHFDADPPPWLQRGRFHERPCYPTGFLIDGAMGRTGNVLLKRDLFPPGEPAFRPEFVTGEDKDFFRRKIAEGRVFIWCAEAVAYETVPPARWTRKFILRRALLRGKYSTLEPTFGLFEVGKSLLAICLYVCALPVLCLLGQHHLMRYLEKLFHHAGKILAVLRLNPIGERYITD